MRNPGLALLVLLFLLPGNTDSLSASTTTTSTASTRTTLITFDVDGTLVHGTGRAAAESVHARAFAHAVATICNDGQPVTPVAQALPRRLYHGSTDGLILLRHVQATCRNVSLEASRSQLDSLMDCM